MMTFHSEADLEYEMLKLDQPQPQFKTYPWETMKALSKDPKAEAASFRARKGETLEQAQKRIGGSLCEYNKKHPRMEFKTHQMRVNKKPRVVVWRLK